MNSQKINDGNFNSDKTQNIIKETIKKELLSQVTNVNMNFWGNGPKENLI